MVRPRGRRAPELPGEQRLDPLERLGGAYSLSGVIRLTMASSPFSKTKRTRNLREANEYPSMPAATTLPSS